VFDLARPDYPDPGPPTAMSAPVRSVTQPTSPAGVDALAEIGSDRAACPTSVVACVDTRLQRTWLQRGGSIVYGPVPFLPGDATILAPPGPTSTAIPLGRFAVGRKNADEYSSEFHEPMPNAVYFAPGGIAFHAGSLGESSHGCVHLSGPDSQAASPRCIPATPSWCSDPPTGTPRWRRRPRPRVVGGDDADGGAQEAH